VDGAGAARRSSSSSSYEIRCQKETFNDAGSTYVLLVKLILVIKVLLLEFILVLVLESLAGEEVDGSGNNLRESNVSELVIRFAQGQLTRSFKSSPIW
jgi:hypothetical protein